MKMIRCPNCHREQPAELGVCENCEEARQEWQKEQQEGKHREFEDDEYSDNLENYNNNK